MAPALRPVLRSKKPCRIWWPPLSFSIRRSQSRGKQKDTGGAYRASALHNVRYWSSQLLCGQASGLIRQKPAPWSGVVRVKQTIKNVEVVVVRLRIVADGAPNPVQILASSRDWRRNSGLSLLPTQHPIRMPGIGPQKSRAFRSGLASSRRKVAFISVSISGRRSCKPEMGMILRRRATT